MLFLLLFVTNVFAGTPGPVSKWVVPVHSTFKPYARVAVYHANRHAVNTPDAHTARPRPTPFKPKTRVPNKKGVHK